ncbi:MAG: ribulose-phosphate 3-epimerase [Eubacteriales bacterium]|nr:ribulose-phosphate 3-epimerase [Eubacteriales bacterium]
MNSDISASIMCADPLHMERDLYILRDNGVAYLHCDVMDGHFVPNLMLGTPTLKAVKQADILPLDLHLMVEEPEKVLDWFAFGEKDLVSVHVETTKNMEMALEMIRRRGATPAIAINPTTPLESVIPFLPELGMLLVMTVQPGFAGQTMSPDSLRKIAEARRMLDEKGLTNIRLEVDGNCSFENAPKMRAAGADVFVAGTSSIFNPSFPLAEGIRRFRQVIKNA